MKKRIVGLDLARALAVIGMIIVNFKIVFGMEGHNILKAFASLFEGKAAATFVILAGVGLALMSKRAVRENDLPALRTTRLKIAKRAIFLFVIGLLYMPIWPADILHYYGIYMLLTLLFLRANTKVIVSAAILFVVLFPVMQLFFDYETGWNWSTLAYLDFWTPAGFIRNLFFNGFHPVIPWVAFMLLGIWFGRQDLSDPKFVRKSMVWGLAIFILMMLVSKLSISILATGDPSAAAELTNVLGTHPMPPMPIYMISASAFAIFVISACILLGEKYREAFIVRSMISMGQLALTFYVAHVIIGMGVIEAIFPDRFGSFDIAFSIGYALIFSLLCIVFAVFWQKKHKHGPLEWLMRKIT